MVPSFAVTAANPPRALSAYYRVADAMEDARPAQGPPEYMAAFGEAPGDGSAPGDRLRTNFPETWIWTNTVAGYISNTFVPRRC